MSAAIKIPPLRFKGFGDAWEEKRLGDAFSMSVSTNTLSRACMTEDGAVRNVHYGDILTKLNSVTNVTSEELPCVADIEFKTSEKKLLHEGDVVLADTAEDALVGKVTEIRNIGCSQVVAGLHTIVLRPNNDFGAGYLGYYFNSDAFHQGLSRIMQGVKVLSINKSFLADYSLLIPSHPEQCQLGSTFRSLDALIEDRESAVEKLRTLKKAMLEKMFPRAGAKVPEVRFKGFAGEWEEKRLEDTFSMSVSTNTFSRACLSEEGTVRNIHYGDILTKLKSVTNITLEDLPYITDKDFKTNAKNLLQDGDVVMADTAEDEMVGKVTEIRNVGCVHVVAGLHTVVLRPLNDFGAGYLGYYLNSDAFHQGLLKIMQGVKVLSINKTFLADYSLLTPSLPEQLKIGAYFRSLDTLISARQEEIGKLKDLKKALLDRMFV